MRDPVFGKAYLTRPFAGTWLPLKLLFILNESNSGGLVYHHTAQRSYLGNFDFQNGHGRGRIDLSGQDGMPKQAVYYPLFSREDGKFYTDLPLGAMPLELCQAYWCDVTRGTKKGIYYIHEPWTFQKVPPFGLIRWYHENKAFVFIAKTETGFEYGGMYRYSETASYTPLFVYHNGRCPNTLYTLEEIYPSVGSIIETWVFQSDGSVTYQKETIPKFSVNLGGSVYWLIQQTPCFPSAGYVWRQVSGMGSETHQRDDGKILNGFPYPERFMYSPYRLVHYDYIPNAYYTWQLTQTVKKTLFLSDIDAAATTWEQMTDGHPFVDYRLSAWDHWYILKISTSDLGVPYKRYVAIDRDSIEVIYNIDGRDYPAYAECSSVRVYNNTPYLVTESVANPGEPVLINMSTGGVFDWRSVFLWNHTLPRTGMDGSIAFHVWGEETEEEPWQYEPDAVLHGDVSLIMPPVAMYIADGSVTELDECSEGYYKAQATFTIKEVLSGLGVNQAAVTCHIVGGIVGQTPAYEDTVTGLTDSNGQVSFENPSCLYGGDPSQTFEIQFTVTDVVKENVLYQESANVLDEVVFTHEDEPPQGTFNPDPAQFTSNSPFQSLYGGTYYHVMEAIVPTTVPADAVVEYNFVCVDNSSIGSGWRNPNNVAGTFYPNGQPQVPQQYWKQVGIKNLMYRWTVQYRIYPSGSTSGVSAAKQIINVLP